MKNIMLLTSLFLMAQSTFAASPVKSCKILLKMDDETVDMKIDIVKKGNGFQAITTQKIEGHENTITQKAQISDHSIQAGLSGDVIENGDIDKLNLGEKLIAHAMLLESEPELGGVFSSGINLKKVHSAKVFQVQEDVSVNIGMAAIVEAKDVNGKVLGSFFGGLLLSPCK